MEPAAGARALAKSFTAELVFSVAAEIILPALSLLLWPGPGIRTESLAAALPSALSAVLWSSGWWLRLPELVPLAPLCTCLAVATALPALCSGLELNSIGKCQG